VRDGQVVVGGRGPGGGLFFMGRLGGRGPAGDGAGLSGSKLFGGRGSAARPLGGAPGAGIRDATVVAEKDGPAGTPEGGNDALPEADRVNRDDE